MDPIRLMTLEAHSKGAGAKTFQLNFGGSESSNSSRSLSILTGRNGGGKSRALRALAILLSPPDALTRIAESSDRWRISYTIGRASYLIQESDRGKREAFRDGCPISLEEAALPSSVIAISAAANDKFPNARRAGLGSNSYRYFGLRDATGRASGTSPLMTALQALSEVEKTDARRSRVLRTVFEMLGYVPRVVQRYRMRSFPRHFGDVSFVTAYSERLIGADAHLRLTRQLKRDPDILHKIEEILVSMRSSSSRKRTWDIEFDFLENEPSSLLDGELSFRDIDLLRRAGLLRLESVLLRRRVDWMEIDLRDASSGQISLATTFIGIAASIEPGSLVLIDEPEISLHPEWQTSYVGLLLKLFAAFDGCQFVIATHSPSLVSGAPDGDSVVLSLDHNRLHSGDGAGARGSVDELLVRDFGVFDSHNLFLQREVARALDLVSAGNLDSTAFRNASENLAPAATALRNEPLGRLINSLLHAAESVASANGNAAEK